MTIQEKTLNEITTQAIEILTQEIGIADTIRFLNQYTKGYGNYTEERNKQFEDMPLDTILSEIRKMKAMGDLSPKSGERQ